MKKALTIILCVFLALVLIGAVVFPNLALDETVSSLSRAFSPVFDAFNFAKKIAEKQFIAETKEREAVLSMIEFAESYTQEYLSSRGDLENYTKQENNKDHVFEINLHPEHKVCKFNISNDGDNYVFSYCAICNKVIAVCTREFFFNKWDWVYPFEDSEVIVSSNFGRAIIFSIDYAYHQSQSH